MVLQTNNKKSLYLLEVAIFAAYKAGTEIISVYNDSSKEIEFELKSDNSPVTIADIRSNDIIVEKLSMLDIPIVSEELPLPSAEERAQMSRFWIIDPLDGTKEFLNRTGEFTVNIALVEDEKAILGIIFVPCENILYFGLRGLGAYAISGSELRAGMDIEKIIKKARLLHTIPKRNTFIIAKSVSFTDERTNKFIDNLLMEHENAEVKQIGSSLKFVRIASREVDCYPRMSQIHEWDIAAGVAIVVASGGKAIDLSTGKEILMNDNEYLTKEFICWAG